MSLVRQLLRSPSRNPMSQSCASRSFARRPLSRFSSVTESSRHTRRYFSTTSKTSSKKRLGRTLYRGLLRWCQETDNEIPLTSFVPPVYLAPDSIEGSGLKALAALESSETESQNTPVGMDPQLEFIRALLPENSIVESSQLTVPVCKSSDILRLMRALFRLNSYSDADERAIKHRTSLAFETLKSLNELTVALQDIKKEREDHLDRSGVLYSIGEVVRHKSDRWRGVIVDWHRRKSSANISPDDIDSPTSLTQKDYTPMMSVPGDAAEKDDIEYSLVLDMGDAHLFGRTRKTNGQSGIPVAAQSELEPVEDERLCHVRSNWTPEHFDRFDARHNSFLPNETKRFAYPSDKFGLEESSGVENVPQDVIKAGEELILGVQDFASRLERCIRHHTSEVKGIGLDLVTAYKRHLSSLSCGDVVSTQDLLSPVSLSSVKLAIKHLRSLLRITMEVSELVWHRRTSKMSKAGIKYELGDVLQHKKYGFRGVVVGWDPKPTVDVSRWDGLTEVEDPMALPFYHIIPDRDDCIRAFGGERPFRYVCEANLEKCSQKCRELDVDLDPGWQYSSPESRYVPPDELKFKYAEELGDKNVTESCMTAIKEELRRFHVAIRESQSNPASVEDNLSMKNLFILLRSVDCMDDAVVVEETIKEIWKAHPDPELRWRLDDGVADLLNGKKEQALSIFSKLVVDDPLYAEAWNKKSTCHFMLDHMDSSLEAAQRTLELQPNHFQALNGVGLVHYETKRYRMSAASFRQSLQLDPWSPVSSRLLLCEDMLRNMGIEGEGSVEGSAPYEV